MNSGWRPWFGVKVDILVRNSCPRLPTGVPTSAKTFARRRKGFRELVHGVLTFQDEEAQVRRPGATPGKLRQKPELLPSQASRLALPRCHAWAVTRFQFSHFKFNREFIVKLIFQISDTLELALWVLSLWILIVVRFWSSRDKICSRRHLAI